MAEPVVRPSQHIHSMMRIVVVGHRSHSGSGPQIGPLSKTIQPIRKKQNTAMGGVTNTAEVNLRNGRMSRQRNAAEIENARAASVKNA